MKRILLLFILISAYSTTYAQFSSVSTNIVGWAAGNINVAVDLNVNLHNTINIPVSANPFKFGETQWSHVVLQPAGGTGSSNDTSDSSSPPRCFMPTTPSATISAPSKGNAYGIGCSWGYSKLLSTRWNFIVEVGAGIVYTPYTEKLRPKYIGEFDDEYTYRHRRFLLVPIKCNLSFSYLF